MALASALLYIAVVYIRPGEIIPGWEGFPFAAIVAAVATVVVSLSLVLGTGRFRPQPHDRYVLGFFAAALLSNISWGWFGGAVIALKIMAPTVLCYFLLRATIQSASNLRLLGNALVVLTLFQAANGISQFWTGVGLGNVAAFEGHAEALDVEDEAPAAPLTAEELQAAEESELNAMRDEENTIRRIRGTGIFNDPNDLAMAFVAVVPFLLGPIMRAGTRLRTRVVLSAVLLPIMTAIAYTNSRGGMVALAAVLAPYSWRLGKVVGTSIAITGLVVALVFGPSLISQRLGQIDFEETSAQGRLQAWSAGLQMLKLRPVLGVGFGQYEEYADRVGHNSFVHSFAELGLVGGFFFAGMIYWMFRGVSTASARAARDAEGRRFRRWGDDLWYGCIGLCASAMFLSRQYNVLMYIWLAMSACYRQVAQESPAGPRPERLVDVGAIGAATLGGVAVIYVIVVSLAVW